MILTNCTDTPRGIALKKGMVIIAPREMREVPQDEQAEIRELFKNPTFQRFVDGNIFRLSKISDDEQSTEVETPEPPVDLKAEAAVEGLQKPAGTATGTLATPPKVVEHQTGGPLEGAESKPKAKVKA